MTLSDALAPLCLSITHTNCTAAYVDEHVEARYEEIVNHLHKALSSTEEDEQDFKVAMQTTPMCSHRAPCTHRKVVP